MDIKKFLIGLCFLFSPYASAQDRGTLGVGGSVGAPFGFSIKHYFSEQFAIDGAFGVQTGDFTFHTDAVFHLPRPLAPQYKGRRHLYLGFGIKFKDEPGTLFGLRWVLGINHWIKDQGVELFAELGPLVRLSPDVGVEPDGAAGIRLYFDISGSAPKKKAKPKNK